jgi:ferri-bacillibactin esterase
VDLDATVLSSRQLDFTSRVNGRSYRLKVAIPFAPAPEDGYPVLYVLDGDAFFGTFSDSARLRGAVGELSPAVVVGLGYQSDDIGVLMREHYRDLIPVEPGAGRRELDGDLVEARGYGGGESLLEVIASEVKPKVADIVAVDPRRSLLFGHSIAGLLVLWAMFSRPEEFETCLALSPTISWNRDAVFAAAASFTSGEAATTPRLYVAAGGLEQTAPSHAVGGLSVEELQRLATAARTIDDSRELVEALNRGQGKPRSEAVFRLFDGQTHSTIVWAALNDMLEFALPPEA